MTGCLSAVVLSCASTLALTDLLAPWLPSASAFRYSLPWVATRHLGLGAGILLALLVFHG